MEEAEKMVALKRAYADIILNTAKEAAARIMVAERKALRFQHDLRSTKDEALQMLIRFKQMIDVKTTEAEIKSLSQQRKIGELEAQLNEAEGMILDLRAELKQAQDQVDKVKNNHVQHLTGPIEKKDMPSCENTTQEKKLTISAFSEPFTSSPSDARPKVVTTCEVKSSPLYQKIQDNYCNSAKQTAISNSHFAIFVDNPSFASKEPELYRNGCTQRIRAMEMNLLDEKLPPGDLADQRFFRKSDSVFNENEQNAGTCTLPSPKAENMDIMKNLAGSMVLRVNTNATKDQTVKVHKMPRRKTRYGKAKATLCRFRPRCQPALALYHCKNISYTDDDNVKSVKGVCSLPSTKAEKMLLGENSSELQDKLQHNKDQPVCILRRSLRKRKVRYHGDSATSCRSLPDQSTEPRQPCSFLSHCKTELVNCNVEYGEDRLKIESEAKIKKDIDLLSASRTVAVDPKDRESVLTQNAVDKDTDLIDAPIFVKEDGDDAESTGVSTHYLNLEVENSPLTDSDSMDGETHIATNGTPSYADSNRLLKYTFSRKRKKESLINPDESSSLGKSSMKRREGEKLNISPEPQKSSLINESSRDSRQLVQVAHQLVALSGKRKRWW